ncbi:MAG: hypothetical protein LBI63_02730 [Candidatus Ancillula sp.]|jgi:NitT/TauT family transport system substrate-binding protein|nr:hypothetical protein [Candidatus Ancillula sp.]
MTVKNINKKGIFYVKVQVALLLVFMLVFASMLTACGTKNTNENTTASLESATLILPDGAPLLSIASLAEGGNINSSGIFQVGDAISKELGTKLGIQVVQDADTLIASIKKEQPELAVVPINLAAKLYNENSAENQYKLLGVSTWGLNEVVANFDISSLKDLVGKKLYSFAKAGTPGVAIRALLKKEGIEYVDFKDVVSNSAVNIVDFTTAPDIVAELSKNLDEPHIALLPQPVASAFALKTQGKYSVKLDLQKLISQAFDGLKYPQAGLIARADIADNANYSNFLNKLVAHIEKTTPSLKENPEHVAKNVKENFKSSALAATEAVVDAIKKGSLDVEFTPVTSKNDVKKDVKAFLQIIYDSGASALIGGKIPDDKFFVLDKG